MKGLMPVSCKKVPENASQHITAGPYSPVLEVKADTLVVISGQCAVDKNGATVGSDIVAQTEFVLKNCLTQLKTAGVGLEDVFKVNVFLSDIGNWPAFNEVYKRIMPDPKPVRTAIQAVLLRDFLVEIEMWAGKNA